MTRVKASVQAQFRPAVTKSDKIDQQGVPHG
jgi:hypothetical protein